MSEMRPLDDQKLFLDFYNASQQRAESWNRLKECVVHLNQSQEAGRATQRLHKECEKSLKALLPSAIFWAFPGRIALYRLMDLCQKKRYKELRELVTLIAHAVVDGSYMTNEMDVSQLVKGDAGEVKGQPYDKPYFETLIVDGGGRESEYELRKEWLALRRSEDSFVYAPVFAFSFEGALIASLLNFNLQAVVIRYDFPLYSSTLVSGMKAILTDKEIRELESLSEADYAPTLARCIKRFRPELDVYLITDRLVEDVAFSVGDSCRRVFYAREDYLELHLNILKGVGARYDTPFFSALKEYSKKPTGVFHAMPISRGKSITKSHWIQDMGEFYGMNTFLAETSATTGGLDSLLAPTGPLKTAQELAARAFGAKHTFFATNGTSTSNKVVVQALIRPNDIVLVDRDCHKSHHYGMVLSGAEVVYLDSYPLSRYSMYGAVPLQEIKHQLLALKAEGKLDRVKMLLLTNCTFDGLVYNVQRVMEECLAIKPDLVFLWDEAWFGFARFEPVYRRRTAMHCADKLRKRYRSDEYRQAYEKHLKDVEAGDVPEMLLPDPDKVRVRVYSTQSTHKTLTSLRQGSMIHVYDQDFNSLVKEAFHEAYMTHTSTSPNYQILASLDIGRRQVELEGFELVQKQTEMAIVLRRQISTHPLLKKYFSILTVEDMVPEEYRKPRGNYYGAQAGWGDIWAAWQNDEFVLDATRVTVMVGGTGMDGDTFKNEILMNRHGIQINKTSRNTILFMTNIGTTRSSVAYLLEVLIDIANSLDERLESASPAELTIHRRNVESLQEKLPPLPDFSRFHDAFKRDKSGSTPEGNIRVPFYLAYDEDNCEYLRLGDEINEVQVSGRELVSAGFVTPYPPGFPILVPGQVISQQILDYLTMLDVKEIHGFEPELGIRVFTEPCLTKVLG